MNFYPIRPNADYENNPSHDETCSMVHRTLAWMKHSDPKPWRKSISYCIKLVLTCCMKMLHIKLWFHHSNISGVGNCSIAIKIISKIFMQSNLIFDYENSDFESDFYLIDIIKSRKNSPIWSKFLENSCFIGGLIF